MLINCSFLNTLYFDVPVSYCISLSISSPWYQVGKKKGKKEHEKEEEKQNKGGSPVSHVFIKACSNP